jgi:hypothetical protein
MAKHRFLLWIMFPALLFFACHPERRYIEDQEAKLTFTLDTLFFDTVFTTVGTVTKSFRVKNPHNQFISIDDISLAGALLRCSGSMWTGIPAFSFPGWK